MKAEDVPLRYRRLYDRALAGNRRAAIKAHCYYCHGWENPAEAVRQCTATGCPLYNVRPGAPKPADVAGSRPATGRSGSGKGKAKGEAERVA